MAKILERMITGGAVFEVPGSVFEILWIGPGTYRLRFGNPRKPRGMTGAMAPEYDLQTDTLHAASDAVDRYLANVEADIAKNPT